ncbi:DNA mismatch repair endonuclease MutH [Anoxybacillus voinovskiensis]|uniref:DNA mismatch repair endonuclease MutH n=1 Tax=Anoxybacteroides voinovskiense TaxID=230470 RepID=A0A840DS67_9BACL|nr:Sau3AI family type II restriction endonuclease [Anoxybacillus voinovskiensis]MBB4074455.1 DNA mismatch repair endonuclease MutH [Anoxybacillus voinovskiensis]GGJ79319.1 DNA mismatch repair protein MutH [Anoxybacillus voinovskiensis]
MIYYTVEEIMAKAREAEGKTFGEIDKYGRLDNNRAKGVLGQVVEESLFGYSINSNSKPDFVNLGVELKVTPFKKNKNGTLSAKERLVLNIINYMEEINCTFETSSFWKKNEKLLLMFYEWIPGLARKDYQIYRSILYTFPEADLEIIKNDWECIVKKIKEGKAHELSEGDTVYLGAAPKGANSGSLREQPFSGKKAMQRAFSLKQSYMTTLVRKFLNNEQFVNFVSAADLKEKTFNEILQNKFSPYIGWTDEEIANKHNIPYNKNSKSLIATIISAVLGIKGTKLHQIEEFSKANIEFKTVRLEPNGKPKESMSFENIDFDKWTSETWEDSYLRHRFYETKFLFVVFEYKETIAENANRKLYFKGIKLWNMPTETIEKEVREFWEEVVRLINTNELKIEYVKRGEKVVETNNFPKCNFNGVMHMRPKAANGDDKILLPNGKYITKQCYWLNNTYIAEVLKDLALHNKYE